MYECECIEELYKDNRKFFKNYNNDFLVRRYIIYKIGKISNYKIGSYIMLMIKVDCLECLIGDFFD